MWWYEIQLTCNQTNKSAKYNLEKTRRSTFKPKDISTMQNISLIFIIIVMLSAGTAFYGMLHPLRQLRLNWKHALGLSSIVALLSGLHQALLSLGNYYDLGLFSNLLYLTAFAANFGIFALPIALCTDIILSMIRLIKGPVLTTPKVLCVRRFYGSALLLIISLTSAVSLYQAYKAPELKLQTIYIQDLHPDLNGFTIAQVSDIHSSPFFRQQRSEQCVSLLKSAAPNLIVFTGDQVDGTPQMRDDDLKPFLHLSAPTGIFYIPGNHEYITGLRPWKQWYSENNLHFLINESRQVSQGNALISIIGLDDDSGAKAAEPGFSGPDLKKALLTLPEKRDDFRLLLAHQPRQARYYAQADSTIDLMLSGHTHGGQVPLLNLMTEAANDGFLKGLYQIGSMQLYVSEGAGLWQGFCARLGTSSEITIFTLRPAHAT